MISRGVQNPAKWPPPKVGIDRANIWGMAPPAKLARPAPAAPVQPGTGVVVVGAVELQAMIRQAVDAALAEHSEAAQAPLLVSRQEMARALGVGVDTLDKLRREGMPEILVGDMPRFHSATVLAWLQSRGK